MFPIFSNYIPKWRCNTTQEFTKSCAVYEECNGEVEFENDYFHSTAMEFEWICGAKAYWASFYSQVQFFGVLAGTVLFGTISDHKGRKPVAVFVLAFGLLSCIFAGRTNF